MIHGNKTRSSLSIAIAFALLAPAAWAQDLTEKTEASADATTPWPE